MSDSDELILFQDPPSLHAGEGYLPGDPEPWLVLVADDEPDVHAVTRMVLRDFEMDNRKIRLLDTHDEESTRQAFLDNPDIAVVLLDVVMENRDSGLRIVEWLRNKQKNRLVRIVLRTGQPGDAPETSVIRDFDINDYKLKTELTHTRLWTVLFASLRSWRDMSRLERNRASLQNVMKAGSRLFSARSLDDFLQSMLDQIAQLYRDDSASMMIRNGSSPSGEGVILSHSDQSWEIVAATGRYRAWTGKTLRREDLSGAVIPPELFRDPEPGEMIRVLDHGLVIFSRMANESGRHMIYLEEAPEHLDMDQVSLFLTNFSLTLDNFYLDHYVRGLQEDILYTFGEVIEKHFHESSHHVRRVSLMMRVFCQALDMSPDQCEMFRVAAILHDVGKIGVPDRILKKPGRLDDAEMAIMREHASIGHEILSRSTLPLFRTAASIAWAHHERWDGTGYPRRIGGGDIPLEARMLCLVDVFDALVNSRVYKEAWTLDDAVAEIRRLSGAAFDPFLAGVFLDHIDGMMDIQTANQ